MNNKMSSQVQQFTEKEVEALKDLAETVILQPQIENNLEPVDKKEIEEKNILEASLIAMERAYKSLNINAEMVIVDGINIPKINTNVKAIKNGDNKSISIASASIIAKVLRDKLMEKLSNKYPRFFWEQNSGYGTKKHIENIKIFGITPHHRKSFKPILKVIK